ncbi:MAG: hypothetical protein P8X96_07015 [Desulfobacteraceae bacterium]|jgi:hypothetical protein
MAEIKDLERCTYFPLDCDCLVAVGWLSGDTNFQKGSVEKDFYEKLFEFAKDPWEPVASAGIHECELCQFNQPGFYRNIFVPYKGKIYVSPEGIVHYIAAHWYQPPNVFIDAVLECPEMRSMEYKKAILANGGRGLLRVKV